MKTISYIGLLVIFFVVLASTFQNPKNNPESQDNITICLDSTCTLSTPITCKLYDSNNVAIRQCEINSLSGNCCTVDSVPFPRTYRWVINNDSTKCEGNTFFYTGGSLTTNFSCNNCR